MATVLKLGPADHDRPMTRAESEAADYEEGYDYELIDGKLYVSPKPNAPQGWVEKWIYTKLDRYSTEHPEVINYVHFGARVFVPGRPGETIPGPDVAAYRNFPLAQAVTNLDWEDVSPLLVVEVVSVDDPKKDLVRNVGLYFDVPTIKEYWAIDARKDADRPSLTVHRRHGKRWKLIELAYGDGYTTRLLPGFELTIDPRS